jgi:ribonuclease HII
MSPRRKRKRSSAPLFRFDRPFWQTHGLIAGIDEAGRGPLAGPVVAAAVILPPCKITGLADSKVLSADQRFEVYRLIQKFAHAIGVGVVPHTEIDRINILQATHVAMRQALSHLVIRPMHILVDGYPLPRSGCAQTNVIDGDAKSASIAAASIVAKVTRDCIMEALDRDYPAYGFKQHKGYGTPDHIEVLNRLGPCDIHRRSFHVHEQEVELW